MANSDVSILLHPGFHKTATTWLQRRIFSDAEAGYCMLSLADATDLFILANPYRFDPDHIRRQAAPLLARARSEELVAVMSCEDLSGYPWGSRYEGRGATERALASFPEAKVLITIREQKGTLLSLYRHYARSLDGANENLARYIGAAPVAPGFSPTFRMDGLEYDLLIRFCQESVGKDRVLVLPMELLTANPTEYWRRLVNFSDARPAFSEETFVARSRERKRVGLNPATAELARLLKPWFRRNTLGPEHPVLTRLKEKLLRRIDPWVPARWVRRLADHQKDAIRSHVGDRYRESNRRTSELTGLDLASWGYDT